MREFVSLVEDWFHHSTRYIWLTVIEIIPGIKYINRYGV